LPTGFGDAVDVGQVRAGGVLRRQQRDAVVGVGVEVDPREDAGRAALVALEEEVLPVPVAGSAPVRLSLKRR
jgi:hypothetical protein